MTKTNRRSLKGGRVGMPIEYFGGNNGRYTVTPAVGGSSAYGPIVARSMGTGDMSNGSVGPNLAAYPGASNMQTGGKRRKTRKRKLHKKKTNHKRKTHKRKTHKRKHNKKGGYKSCNKKLKGGNRLRENFKCGGRKHE